MKDYQVNRLLVIFTILSLPIFLFFIAAAVHPEVANEWRIDMRLGEALFVIIILLFTSISLFMVISLLMIYTLKIVFSDFALLPKK